MDFEGGGKVRGRGLVLYKGLGGGVEGGVYKFMVDVDVDEYK